MPVPTLNYVDRVVFNAASGGIGNFSQQSAVSGYQTMQNAGAIASKQYGYVAQSADLAQWEVGYGTWDGSSLSRTVLFNSLVGTSPINFTLAPQFMITALAESLGSFGSGSSSLA